MRTVGKTFKEKPKASKKEIIALLKEKGIAFDEKATAAELEKLIPKE